MSLKVATADGGTDVSQVIAAIDWVVEHRNDNGLNIRVLNLSYGTNSTQSYLLDPLAYAVEQAWKKGIVVVAAAGNTGYQRGQRRAGSGQSRLQPVRHRRRRLRHQGHADLARRRRRAPTRRARPAGRRQEPRLRGTRLAPPGPARPELLHRRRPIPRAVLGDRYFRGTGTSQAAALDERRDRPHPPEVPNLTPDQVKRFITDNAQKLPSSDSQAQGAGEAQPHGQLLTKTRARHVQKFAARPASERSRRARGRTT